MQKGARGLPKFSYFCLVMKKYKQLNLLQRCEIFAYLQANFRIKEIAERLNVHKSTIYRELSRNKGKRKYSPKLAQELATLRKERSPGNRAITDWVKRRCLKELTENQWSPEQISGRLKLEGISVSHETIYKMIRDDKENGGTLYLNCRHHLKKRRRPVGNSIPIKDRVCIEERPPEVDGRRFGDFELDTIVGKNGQGTILTIVEKSTNYTLVAKLPKGKNAKGLAKVVVKLLLPFKNKIRTITTDNGTEFAEHKYISKMLDTTVYFAHPYCSWEKGCIENQNKLIRQYIPKQADFALVDDTLIRSTQYKLNHRPREKLNFFTPFECFIKNFD